MTIPLIVLLNVTLLVIGQILWKMVLKNHPLDSFGSLITLMYQPLMWLGGILFVLATLIWFYALSRYDLSRIYPLQSTAYVVGAISGIVFFKETVSLMQWLGIILILGGAFLVSRT